MPCFLATSSISLVLKAVLTGNSAHSTSPQSVLQWSYRSLHTDRKVKVNVVQTTDSTGSTLEAVQQVVMGENPSRSRPRSCPHRSEVALTLMLLNFYLPAA